MGYRTPESVVSPKKRWELQNVLCNTGQGGWSVAEGLWDGEHVLAMRWNGDDESGNHGNPQSHGNPTYFIIPQELADAVRKSAQAVHETIDKVSCKIWRPEGFDLGAFMVAIELNGAVRDRIGSLALCFDIPRFSTWILNPGAEYFASENGKLCGKLRDGCWECPLYSNGVAFKDNPTALDVVRDALVSNVIQKLKPWN
jgi:hypothetical protein